MTKLSAIKRDPKSRPDSYRKNGQIPGIVYGKDTTPVSIAVDETAFVKALREEGESSVFSLNIAGDEHDVIVQDIAQHPITGKALNVDFLAIKKGQKINVEVPLEFIGESPAVKQGLGVLVKVLHEIEVETLPQNLPQHIDVDISKLEKVGDSISVSNLMIPEGVKPEIDINSTIATISAQKEEEPEEPEETPDLSEIEVEQKGKKEEESVDGGESSRENKDGDSDNS